MKKFNTLFVFLLFAFVANAQRVRISIEVNPSSNSGKQRVSVIYTAADGDFVGGNGTDEWNAQTITLGWPPSSGMTVSAPNPNPNISAFNTLSSAFNFVDNFTASGNIISYTLDQVGGTSDGNVYTSFVVNGSTSNQPLADAVPITVFSFDVPVTWTNSIFLLTSQPSGPSIGLAPVILNSILGQVWDQAPASAPLPVELTHFQAILLPNQTTQLDWQTATELNNQGFEVERSQDARNWEAIGFVKGQGTTTELQDYRQIDLQPYTGLNYYRLRQIDFDGGYEYSPVRSVRVESGQGQGIRVYPNPFREGELNLNFTTAVVGSGATLRIFDINGQALRQVALKGQHNAVGIEQLPAGVYLLEVADGREVWRERLVVQ